MFALLVFNVIKCAFFFFKRTMVKCFFILFIKLIIFDHVHLHHKSSWSISYEVIALHGLKRIVSVQIFEYTGHILLQNLTL